MRLMFLLLCISLSFTANAAAVPSPVAKAAFDRGERFLDSGKYDEAVTAYKEALAATPGYAAALNGLGSALFKLKRNDEAMVHFKAATEADPTFKLAWFNLGYGARKAQDYATAVAAYEKYTALDAADPDGFYGLGESYKGLKQNDKAVAAYETFIKKETRPSEQKWVDRARESIASLKTAPAPEPSAPAAAAVAVAPTPATTPPPTNESMPALAARKIAEGDKLMSEKKYREASFAYQDAVNVDPNNVEALFDLARAYAVLGYYDQAIERWNRVLQINPSPEIQKNAQDNITRARQKMALVGGGSPQEQNKAPGSGPIADTTRQQARQHYEQGVQFFGSARYSEALAALNECLKLEPALAVGYVARGSTLIGLRRYSEAAVDYQYALKLDPTMSAPLYGLGEAYRGLNRVDDARSYYSKYVASSAQDIRPELQTEARKMLEQLPK